MKKQRQSNFELLRIIIMFLIVIHHSIVHGVSLVTSDHIINYGVADTLALFGKVAVAVFVMISGYFLIYSKPTKKKFIGKIIHLIAQIYFYSLSIYFIAKHFNVIKLNEGYIRDAFNPIFNNTYWFATVYLIIYLLFPYLNTFIHQLTKQQLGNLIIGSSFFLTVIPLLFPNAQLASGPSYVYILDFILYYLIGAFCRLYTIKSDHFEKWSMGFSLIILSTFAISSLFFITNNAILRVHKFNMLAPTFQFWAGTHSIFVLACAIGMLYFFKHIHIPNSHIINTIASTTFGIYLIHDNPITRQWLWKIIFNTNAIFNTRGLTYFVCYILAVAVIVFIACSLIDYVRSLIFNLVQWIWHKLTAKSLETQ